MTSVPIAFAEGNAYSNGMRVTGGVLGGRTIEAPRGQAVRPTQDRVRLALFSSLASRVAGCRFLDLFAGSGAVGLEAWSRGAVAVCWVEQSARVLPVLRRNVETLCGSAPGGAWRVVRADALRFVERAAPAAVFDIVFADPPYDREGRRDWVGDLLRSLRRAPILAPGGIFAMEQAADEPAVSDAGWTVTGPKVYGGTRLYLFNRSV